MCMKAPADVSAPKDAEKQDAAGKEAKAACDLTELHSRISTGLSFCKACYMASNESVVSPVKW